MHSWWAAYDAAASAAAAAFHTANNYHMQQSCTAMYNISVKSQRHQQHSHTHMQLCGICKAAELGRGHLACLHGVSVCFAAGSVV